VIRWLTDKIRDRRGYNDAQKARVDNAGILAASGLIAGEALCGLAIAAIWRGPTPQLIQHPHWVGTVIGMAALIFILMRYPLTNAGSPDEPAPPTAIM
jgi:hypothetical protein